VIGPSALDVSHEVGVLRRRLEEAEHKIRLGGSDAASDAVRLLEANRRHFSDLGSGNSSLWERQGVKFPREVFVEANGIMAYSGSMLGQLYAKAPGMQEAAILELEKACPRLYRMSKGARQSNDNWLSCFAALADLYAAQSSVQKSHYLHRSAFETPEDQLRNLLNAHAMQVLSAPTKAEQRGAYLEARKVTEDFVTTHFKQLGSSEADAMDVGSILEYSRTHIYIDAVAREAAHYLSVLDHITREGFSFVETETVRVKGLLTEPEEEKETVTQAQMEMDFHRMGLQTRSEILATMKFLAARLAVRKGTAANEEDAAPSPPDSLYGLRGGLRVLLAIFSALLVGGALLRTRLKAWAEKRKKRKSTTAASFPLLSWILGLAAGVILYAEHSIGTFMSVAGRKRARPSISWNLGSASEEGSKGKRGKPGKSKVSKGKGKSKQRVKTHATPAPPSTRTVQASAEPSRSERPQRDSLLVQNETAVVAAAEVAVEGDDEGWETVTRSNRRSRTSLRDGAHSIDEPKDSQAGKAAEDPTVQISKGDEPAKKPKHMEASLAATSSSSSSTLRVEQAEEPESRGAESSWTPESSTAAPSQALASPRDQRERSQGPWAAHQSFDDDSDGSTSASATSSFSGGVSAPSTGEHSEQGHGMEVSHAYSESLESLKGQVRRQIEYYFSVDNLCKDIYLRRNMDPEGFVSFGAVCGFNRVQALSTDHLMILDSVQDSEVLEVKIPWSLKVALSSSTLSSAQAQGGGGSNPASPRALNVRINPELFYSAKIRTRLNPSQWVLPGAVVPVSPLSPGVQMGEETAALTPGMAAASYAYMQGVPVSPMGVTQGSPMLFLPPVSPEPAEKRRSSHKSNKQGSKSESAMGSDGSVGKAARGNRNRTRAKNRPNAAPVAEGQSS